MNKKVLTLLLATFLIFILCLTVVACGEKEDNVEGSIGLVFTLKSDDTYEVTGYTKNPTDVVIPNFYKGKAVTSVRGSAFEGCYSLTSVRIGERVTNIGIRAFSSCLNLKRVTISNSVRIIGADAFYGCISLQTATIGNSVTSIGSSAFHSCKSLQSITMGGAVTSIGQGAFSGCKSLQSLNYLGTIDSWCGINFDQGDTNPLGYVKDWYINGESVVDLVIPDTVTSISYCAFWHYKSFQSVTIPDTVTSIGDFAFEGCSNLTIYCEAESKPDGWNEHWNSGNRPVHWGYKRIG